MLNLELHDTQEFARLRELLSIPNALQEAYNNGIPACNNRESRLLKIPLRRAKPSSRHSV